MTGEGSRFHYYLKGHFITFRYFTLPFVLNVTFMTCVHFLNLELGMEGFIIGLYHRQGTLSICEDRLAAIKAVSSWEIESFLVVVGEKWIRYLDILTMSYMVCIKDKR